MQDIINEIKEKIKEFTKKQPTFNGVADPDYQVYLAECARLSEITTELSQLQYRELPSSVQNAIINGLKNEVDKITSRR